LTATPLAVPRPVRGFARAADTRQLFNTSGETIMDIRARVFWDEADGWCFHISYPGRPGYESGPFKDRAEAVAGVMAETEGNNAAVMIMVESNDD
jgi:hypothetical protein